MTFAADSCGTFRRASTGQRINSTNPELESYKGTALAGFELKTICFRDCFKMPRELGGVQVKNHCVGLRPAPPLAEARVTQLATASFRDKWINWINDGFPSSHVWSPEGTWHPNVAVLGSTMRERPAGDVSRTVRSQAYNGKVALVMLKPRRFHPSQDLPCAKSNKINMSKPNSHWKFCYWNVEFSVARSGCWNNLYIESHWSPGLDICPSQPRSASPNCVAKAKIWDYIWLGDPKASKHWWLQSGVRTKRKLMQIGLVDAS